MLHFNKSNTEELVSLVLPDINNFTLISLYYLSWFGQSWYFHSLAVLAAVCVIGLSPLDANFPNSNTPSKHWPCSMWHVTVKHFSLLQLNIMNAVSLSCKKVASQLQPRGDCWSPVTVLRTSSSYRYHCWSHNYPVRISYVERFIKYPKVLASSEKEQTWSLMYLRGSWKGKWFCTLTFKELLLKRFTPCPVCICMSLALQLRAPCPAGCDREDKQDDPRCIFHLYLRHITGASWLLFTIFINILLDSSLFFKPFLFVSRLTLQNSPRAFGITNSIFP